MRHMLRGGNIALISARSNKSQTPDHFFCSRYITEAKTGESTTQSSLFSLYQYPNTKNKGLFDEDENFNIRKDRNHALSLSFVSAFTDHLGIKFISDGKGDLQQTFGPEDIFSYMYAIFHAPSYRERYAEFLKIDFPRLPLTSNTDLFRELCKLGDRLVGLHLMEKFGKITTRYPVSGNDMVEKIDYTSPADAPEQDRVWINKTQYIDGVSLEVWEFHIGGYQVCQKWMKDRKGRKLEFNDIKHYQRMVAALAETIQLMGQIDEIIDEHGGWPIQ